MTNGVSVFRNRRYVFTRLEKFIAIFAFTVFVCPGANALERIRIGLSVRNVVFLPFYYAQEKAIYEKYGLHAELIQIRSDLQTVGLVSGEIDFTPVIGPAVSAIANGMPLRAVAVMYRAPVFSLVSPGSFAHIKDLEGRQVAVSRLGSDSHRYGVMMMENSGVDVKRVTFIQTGSTTVSLAALQQGAVAAAVLSPPFTGAMAEKGYKVLARSRALVELPWMGMVTSKQKIERQPDQVQRVLRSLRDALAIMRRDKPGLVAYIEAQFKVSPAVAAEAYDDINGIMVDNLVMPEEPIKKFLEAMHSRGDIPRSLTPADAFDFALVKTLK
jgi:ABC-type nitrate/sulfonate/bicarbonate transport system substrate-binding protein